MTTALEGGEGVSVTLRALFTPWEDQVPIAQEAGWASGPVWTDAENLAPNGIRSPDRPARSQSTTLPGPLHCCRRHKLTIKALLCNNQHIYAVESDM